METRLRNQIPAEVRVRQLSYFTKCHPGNLENTTENDKERLSNSFEWKFYKNFYSLL